MGLSEAQVISKAAARAASQLEIPNTVLAKILGISEASASRLKTGAFVTESQTKPFELAVLFVRLFRGLDAIVGGDANSARSWLKAENIALGNRPISLIQTVQGLMQVVQYVDARRARV
jgi:uncharacterized protein (DUF2384 family)